jgi:hypothetical protein
MKYRAPLLFFFFCTLFAQAQGTLPPTFFEGKSVVLVSNDPGAKPSLTWQVLADSMHSNLVRAGGDPAAYYELEQVALSAERQAEYAKAFLQRQIQNIILITRQKEQTSIHVGKFSGDGKLITEANLFGVSGKDWKTAGQQFAGYGGTTPTKNLLVPDLAEFPVLVAQTAGSSAQKFISRNPLNLEVFRLGIPLEGTSAVTGPINTFRYVAYGKSGEVVLAEQSAQKKGLEEIFSSTYPHEVAWMVEAKSNPQLIADRIQFVLVKVEGRQADLMKSMGLEPLTGEEGSKIVVKYYIRFLVREELYLGPVWDAHPDWRIALKQFLDNLKK